MTAIAAAFRPRQPAVMRRNTISRQKNQFTNATVIAGPRSSRLPCQYRPTWRRSQRRPSAKRTQIRAIGDQIVERSERRQTLQQRHRFLAFELPFLDQVEDAMRAR